MKASITNELGFRNRMSSKGDDDIMKNLMKTKSLIDKPNWNKNKRIDVQPMQKVFSHRMTNPI